MNRRVQEYVARVYAVCGKVSPQGSIHQSSCKYLGSNYKEADEISSLFLMFSERATHSVCVYVCMYVCMYMKASRSLKTNLYQRFFSCSGWSCQMYTSRGSRLCRDQCLGLEFSCLGMRARG